MEKISIETINYIAKLSKLKFSEKDALELAEGFQGILSHFRNIDNVDLTDVEEATQEEMKAVLRKDEEKYFEDKKELFQNAKGLKDGYIAIPKVVE